MLTLLGLVSFFSKNDAKAKELLSQALNVNNFYVPGLVALGELLRTKGLSSRKYYGRALHEDPTEMLAIKGLIKQAL